MRLQELAQVGLVRRVLCDLVEMGSASGDVGLPRFLARESRRVVKERERERGTYSAAPDLLTSLTRWIAIAEATFLLKYPTALAPIANSPQMGLPVLTNGTIMRLTARVRARALSSTRKAGLSISKSVEDSSACLSSSRLGKASLSMAAMTRPSLTMSGVDVAWFVADAATGLVSGVGDLGGAQSALALPSIGDPWLGGASPPA